MCVLSFLMLDLFMQSTSRPKNPLFQPIFLLQSAVDCDQRHPPNCSLLSQTDRALASPLSLSKVCLLVLLYLSWLFPECSPNCKHFPQAAEKTLTQDCSNSQIHAKWRRNIFFQLLRSLCLQSKDHISTVAHCHTIRTCTELSYFFTTWWFHLHRGLTWETLYVTIWKIKSVYNEQLTPFSSSLTFSHSVPDICKPNQQWQTHEMVPDLLPVGTNNSAQHVPHFCKD